MSFKNMGLFRDKNDDDDLDHEDMNIFTPFDFDDRPASAKVVGMLKGMGTIAFGIVMLFALYAILPGLYKLIINFAIEFFDWADRVF